MNYYNQIIKKLKSLEKDYPSYTMGMHLATALSDYPDIFLISDKEFLFALDKYETQQSLDVFPLKNVDKIIEDGKDLDKLFRLEEDTDGY